MPVYESKDPGAHADALWDMSYLDRGQLLDKREPPIILVRPVPDWEVRAESVVSVVGMHYEHDQMAQ